MRKVLFLGSKLLGFNILQSLYKAVPEVNWHIIHSNDLDDKRSAYSNFDQFSKKTGVSIEIYENNKSLLESINAFKPDIIVVSGWYRIIDDKIIDRFSTIIGVHVSLLPRYRGFSPLVWSLINGDKVVGASIFKIDSGVDSGDILLQHKVKLKEDDSIGDVLDNFNKNIPAKFSQLWPKIIAGNYTTMKRNNEMATYCGYRSESDGKINWLAPAKEIFNFIRAQSSPYPGAFTYLKKFDTKIKVTIEKAAKHNKNFNAMPGQIVELGEGYLVVACGDGNTIKILSMSYQGSNKHLKLIVSTKQRFCSD